MSKFMGAEVKPEKLRSMTDVKEGWQAQGSTATRVYHFIRDTMAICGRFGFYTGDLVPDVATAPKGDDDCSACFKKLRGEQARAAKKAAKAAEKAAAK